MPLIDRLRENFRIEQFDGELTDEQIKEIKRKLWGGVDEQKWPKQIVRLEGLWKDTPSNLTDEDFRQTSHELSEALKRRAEKVL